MALCQGYVRSHRSSVILYFFDRALILPSCECAAWSVLEPCALSSACLVSCCSVVFGSWHSCLGFRDGVRILSLHVLSHCVSVRSRVRSAARSSVHVCFVVLHAVRVFIGCVLSCCCVLCEHVTYEFSLAVCSCLLHMAGDLFAGHVLVFLVCVSTWLLS